jgi:phosphoribosyl 1,2-cyclic phosphate phosphodiesterase
MKEILFLGSGSSLGVPVVGCNCEVCRSSSFFNKRLRPSILMTLDHRRFLFDATPDFRQQALKYDIHTLDGAFFTHLHYDHMGGFDDLRVFSFFQKRPLPILLSESTFKEIKKRFDYLFKGEDIQDFQATKLTEEFGEVSFAGLKVTFVSYFQGKIPVLGYRIGNFAYVTDISCKYDERVIEPLKGVEILVVSALKEEVTHVHFGFKEAIAFAEKIGAKKVFISHLAHEIDYEKCQQKLPSHIHLAYDGLKIEI